MDILVEYLQMYSPFISRSLLVSSAFMIRSFIIPSSSQYFHFFLTLTCIQNEKA